jgi:hypothetical protein
MNRRVLKKFVPALIAAVAAVIGLATVPSAFAVVRPPGPDVTFTNPVERDTTQAPAQTPAQPTATTPSPSPAAPVPTTSPVPIPAPTTGAPTTNSPSPTTSTTRPSKTPSFPGGIDTTNEPCGECS